MKKALILLTIVMLFGVGCATTELETNVVADIEVILNGSPHGFNHLSGGDVSQAIERMKNNTDQYLIAIDELLPVSEYFTKGVVSEKDSRRVRVALDMIAELGGEEGKALLRKWYRIFSDAEFKLNENMQEIPEEKDSGRKTRLSISRVAGRAGRLSEVALYNLAYLKDDSMVDECLNDVLKNTDEHEIVKLRYIRHVMKGRKDFIKKIMEKKQRVKDGSHEERVLRKLLRYLEQDSKERDVKGDSYSPLAKTTSSLMRTDYVRPWRRLIGYET